MATRLIEHARCLAEAHRRTTLDLRYSTSLAGQSALDATLDRSGFGPAQPELYRFKAPVSVIDDLQWERYLRRARRQHYQSVPWQELSVSRKEEFTCLCQDYEVAQYLRPFAYLNQSYPPLTIACMQADRPVGWITAHLEGDCCLYFSSGYVIPEFQRAGWLVAAIADVRQRFKDLHGTGKDWNFHYTTDADNQPMRSLIKRYLAPRALWTDQILRRQRVIPVKSS